MLEEEVQHNPQKALCDQVCKNARDENWTERLLSPNRICERNYTFNDDCYGKRVNHFFLER